MAKYICFIALLINSLYYVAGVSESATYDYTWRDFKGVIPSDAFAGGIDELGRPMYIGQVLFENKLIPAKIYMNDPNAYFDWGHERTATANVKILCTEYPEKFEWFRARRENVVHLPGKTLIVGGFQPAHTTYIGRVAYDGEILIGKVLCNARDCLALRITKNGKSANYKGEFYVLTYNKDAILTNIIDVRC